MASFENQCLEIVRYMTKVKSNHIISHCVFRLGRRSRKGFFPTDGVRASLKSGQIYQCWFRSPSHLIPKF